MSSPTSRSLALLRRCGYLCEVCETWVPRANVRRDLFHVADVIGVHAIRREVLLIQATSLSNLPARVKKVRGQVELPALLRAGLTIECWGWYERGGRWKVKRVALTGQNLEAINLTPRPKRGRRDQQRLLFDGQERRERTGKGSGVAQDATGDCLPD
jgi:hypothetical protein